MNEKILKQIPNIKKEIAELEKEITIVEKQIDDLERDKICDMVVGSRSDLTIGPIRIRGHPKGYENKIGELQKKKTLMNGKKIELLQVENEAEAYINSIQDSRLRRIMRYRYMDGLRWQQVAEKMGPPHTADGCRMAHKRFMGD